MLRLTLNATFVDEFSSRNLMSIDIALLLMFSTKVDCWNFSLSRRCLMSILADFFTPEIIHDGKYKFSQSGKYFAPPKGTYESYVEFIKVNLV